MSSLRMPRKSIRWVDDSFFKFLFNAEVSNILIPSCSTICSNTVFKVIFEVGDIKVCSKEVIPQKSENGEWLVDISESIMIETSLQSDLAFVYKENIGKLIVMAQHDASAELIEALEYCGSTSLKLHTLATAAGGKAIQKQFALPLKKFVVDGAILNVLITAEYLEEILTVVKEETLMSPPLTLPVTFARPTSYMRRSVLKAKSSSDYAEPVPDGLQEALHRATFAERRLEEVYAELSEAQAETATAEDEVAVLTAALEAMETKFNEKEKENQALQIQLHLQHEMAIEAQSSNLNTVVEGEGAPCESKASLISWIQSGSSSSGEDPGTCKSEKDELRHMTMAFEMTKKTMAEMDSAMNSLSIQLVAKEEVVQSLRTELSNVTSLLQDVEKSKRVLAANLDALQARCLEYEVLLQTPPREKSDEVEKSSEIPHDSSNDRIHELEASQKELEVVRDKLLERLSLSERQVASLSKQCTDLTSQCTGLSGQSADLMTKLEQAKDSTNTANDKDSLISSLQSKIEALEKELILTKAIHSESENTRQQLTSQMDGDNNQNLRGLSPEQLPMSLADLEKLTSAEAKVATLTKQMASKVAELNTLRVRQQQSESTVNHLNCKLEAVELELETMKSRCVNLAADVEEKQSTLEKRALERDESKRVLEAVELELETMKSRCINLAADVEEKQSILEKRALEWAESERVFQLKIEALETELGTTKIHLNNMSLATEEKEMKLTSMIEQEALLKCSFQELQQSSVVQLVEKETLMDDLRNKISHLEASLEEAIVMLEEENTRNAKVHAALSEAESNVSSLTTNLSTRDSEITKLESKLLNCTLRLGESEAVRKELSLAKDELQAEVSHTISRVSELERLLRDVEENLRMSSSRTFMTPSPGESKLSLDVIKGRASGGSARRPASGTVSSRSPSKILTSPPRNRKEHSKSRTSTQEFGPLTIPGQEHLPDVIVPVDIEKGLLGNISQLQVSLELQTQFAEFQNELRERMEVEIVLENIVNNLLINDERAVGLCLEAEVQSTKEVCNKLEGVRQLLESQLAEAHAELDLAEMKYTDLLIKSDDMQSKNSALEQCCMDLQLELTAVRSQLSGEIEKFNKMQADINSMSMELSSVQSKLVEKDAEFMQIQCDLCSETMKVTFAEAVRDQAKRSLDDTEKELLNVREQYNKVTADLQEQRQDLNKRSIEWAESEKSFRQKVIALETELEVVYARLLVSDYGEVKERLKVAMLSEASAAEVTGELRRTTATLIEAQDKAIAELRQELETIGSAAEESTRLLEEERLHTKELSEALVEAREELSNIQASTAELRQELETIGSAAEESTRLLEEERLRTKEMSEALVKAREELSNIQASTALEQELTRALEDARREYVILETRRHSQVEELQRQCNDVTGELNRVSMKLQLQRTNQTALDVEWATTEKSLKETIVLHETNLADLQVKCDKLSGELEETKEKLAGATEAEAKAKISADALEKSLQSLLLEREVDLDELRADLEHERNYSRSMAITVENTSDELVSCKSTMKAASAALFIKNEELEVVRRVTEEVCSELLVLDSQDGPIPSSPIQEAVAKLKGLRLNMEAIPLKKEWVGLDRATQHHVKDLLHQLDEAEGNISKLMDENGMLHREYLLASVTEGSMYKTYQDLQSAFVAHIEKMLTQVTFRDIILVSLKTQVMSACSYAMETKADISLILNKLSNMEDEYRETNDQEQQIRDLIMRLNNVSLELRESSRDYTLKIADLEKRLAESEKNEARLLEDNEALDKERWAATVAETAAQAVIVDLRRSISEEIEERCKHFIEMKTQDLKVIIGIMTQELGEYKGQCEDYDAQIDDCRKQIENYSREIKRLSSLEAKLTKQLADAKTEISDLQSSLITQNDEAEREIDDRDRIIRNMNGHMLTFKATASETAIQLKHEKRQHQEANQQLAEANKKLEDSDAIVAKLANEVVLKEEELNLLRKMLLDKAILEAKLAECQERAHEAESQLTTLATNIASTEPSASMTSKDAATILRNQISSLQELLGIANDEVKTLMLKNQQLHEEASRANAEVRMLTAEHQAMQAYQEQERLGLEAELQALRATAGRDMDAYEDTLSAKEHELEALRSELELVTKLSNHNSDERKQALMSATEQKMALALANTEIERYRSEVEVLLGKLQQASSTSQDSSTESKTAMDETDESCGMAPDAELKTEVSDKAEGRSEDKPTDTPNAQSICNSSDQSHLLSSSDSQLEKHPDAVVEALLEQVRSLESECQRSAVLIESWKDKNASLSAENDELSRRVSELGGEVEALMKELEDDKARVETQKEIWVKSLEEWTKKEADLVSEKTAMEEKLAHALAENNFMSDELCNQQKLSRQFKRDKQRVLSLEKELQEAQAEIERFKSSESESESKTMLRDLDRGREREIEVAPRVDGAIEISNVFFVNAKAALHDEYREKIHELERTISDLTLKLNSKDEELRQLTERLLSNDEVDLNHQLNYLRTELESARVLLKERGITASTRKVIVTDDMDLKEGRGVQQF